MAALAAGAMMKLVPPFNAASNGARYWRPPLSTRDGRKSIIVVVDLMLERAVLEMRKTEALRRTVAKLLTRDSD
jgi:hypothetical protein